ncbi:hypothetical protein F53441_924 [Fusarium austroafricanum]|uniref:CBM-cenC domain-containing protein n=1 Tax=Fusarium austroafricanum TaxID=2364996 RepID=A0A8H4KVV2_9HYPO|nr:hypothetical protein F53441_924 [Fusarium austroafricanum]
MVLIKRFAVAYAAANLLGVNAGPCRPVTKTSSSLSASETLTVPTIVSTSTSGSSAIPTDGTTSSDLTSSTGGTTASNPTTSGNPTSSGSETLSSSILSSNPTTSGSPTSLTIATSGSSTISVDLTTSGSPTTSSDATSSVESTVSAGSTISNNPTTATVATTSAESTTSNIPTTTASPTTTMDSTTTAAPTTTTSVCVEPTNMLRRPGFEDPEVGDVWGFYWGGGQVTEDSEHARHGDYLAVLPVPDGQERRMEQRIHIVPGTEYTISFWYAVANPPSVNTQCYLYAIFDYYTQLKQVPLPSDSDYHQYTASFISADNLDPAVEIGIACPQQNNGYTATIYIDDTEVMDPSKDCDATPVDPNAPPKSTLLIPAEPEEPRCPVNIVKIPGFETEDDNQAWSFADDGEFVHDIDNARTGEWEALLPGRVIDNYILLQQDIDSADLVVGEQYDYHFFWKPKTLPNNGQCYISGGYNYLAYPWAPVKFGATSSTGYTIFSARFTMPSGPFTLQIFMYCDYNDGNTEPGAVYVDDTALIRVGGCEAYPKTGALIENPSFEIRATDDSTYAWFGTNGMTIKAGAEDGNGPVPQSGNNFAYIQLESTKKSATLTKPLASSLNAGQTYNLKFSWSAGSAYSPGDCSFKVDFGSVSQTSDLNSNIIPYGYQLFDYSFTPAEQVRSMSVTVSCTSGFPDFVFDGFSLN